MTKRNKTTKELALQLHTDVAEVRKLRALDAKEATLEQEVIDAKAATNGSAAHYCYTRTDGSQHSIERFGEKYCTLQMPCKYQKDNGHKAKFCRYKKR
ncbi:hypothetical protein KY333_01100 [Candidatus Woesearchaeota archaeon]|nr:hypothetical protein [Candidatus Woesearchaeota archaeon]